MIPTLRLTVTEPDSIPAQDRVRAVTGTALRIGREADNDWILTDPARRMSRHHCTIDFQGGVYVVIDTSANGVFHNDATRALGRGSSRILSDGDVLRFPGVTLAVALIEDSDARDAFRAVLPPRRGAPTAGAAAEPLDDLLAQPAASWGADPLDDTALPEAPDAGLPFGAGPFPSLSLATSAIDGSALSWSQERRAAPAPTQVQWSRLGVGDRSEAEHQAFSSSLPGQAVIPEDWDLDAPPPPALGAEIPSDWSDEAPEPPRPVAARLAPPGPVPIPVPASGDEALLLALVAALARIERALLGPDVGLMQGPAETVLRRLRATEPGLADRAIALIAERAAERIDAPSEDPMVSRQAATAPSRPGDDA
ncbi:FHA domain-containing protein [Methylobacterium oryzihabitans]|uniref:FHA domain-containing protein n=1 Tax=Methylobacterium oryzihabitans TaxID=2499852 RepID=UPI0016525AFA|nr:FHA domain-containing protein [Methylobacterium oryzihabitans]